MSIGVFPLKSIVLYKLSNDEIRMGEFITSSFVYLPLVISK